MESWLLAIWPHELALAFQLPTQYVTNAAALADCPALLACGRLNPSRPARLPRNRTGARPDLVRSKGSSVQAFVGYADTRRMVAVVSTARLDDPAHPELLAARIINEAAHELGALNGLRHCKHPGCVMHPVTAAGELDRRRATPCGACPRRGVWARRLATVAAAAAMLALALSLNLG